jgi:PhnB protein
MAMHPYRFFSGSCREAFTRYEQIFGGELELMAMSDVPEGEDVPAGDPSLIMHASLTFGDNLLMGSDDPTGDGGPVQGVAISYTAEDVDEAERVFAALAEDGEVTMPLAPAFWSPLFGMCTDEFGTPWMVSVAAVEAT